MATNVFAHIATVAQRREQFDRVVEAVGPHVNSLVVHWSEGYPRKGPDYADGGKFLECDREGWHILIDDDLNYPLDFVPKIVDAASRHGCPVSYGGKRFEKPVRSYYWGATRSYSVLQPLAEDAEIDVPITAAFAFHSSMMTLTVDDAPEPFMSDIWAALAARRQEQRIMCLAHERGWITHQPVDHQQTIWGRFNADDARQTELVNRLFAMRTSASS